MKLYDVKAVARWLDLSERRVRQLRDDGVIVEARPGLYDLMETNRNYINYLRKKNPDSEEAVDYNIERAKLARAKRKNEEYDLKVKEGTLHASEDIETVMTDMLINFKTRLMALATKLSPILAKKSKRTEVFEIMKASIDEALLELSDFETVFGEKVKPDEEIDS